MLHFYPGAVKIPSSTKKGQSNYALALSLGDQPLLLLAFNRFVDFLPMHGHLFGSFDPQSDLVAKNLDDRNYDVVAKDDALMSFSG